MERQKYLVRVVRPVFEAAYLEVEARDENEACSTAMASAYQLPAEKWSGRFNPDDYFVDAHCVRRSQTQDGHPFTLLDFPLYLIMNTNHSPSIAGAGEPWMNYVQPMEVASLMSEWIDQLAESRDGYYQEAIEHFEEMLKAWKGTDQKVVPLMPPEERRFNIGMVEKLLEGIRLIKETD
ncbi:MAG TPA: hypothetical protein VJ550_01830 [Geomonas sp.]|nr:hypothetical protein [Geomonas sp.]